ncbi:MAG TPA: hypothetical protein DCG49_02380 [Ruminococcus sp.]|nr:hypothetical protein [Ruminococcus sp.]
MQIERSACRKIIYIINSFLSTVFPDVKHDTHQFVQKEMKTQENSKNALDKRSSLCYNKNA